MENVEPATQTSPASSPEIKTTEIEKPVISPDARTDSSTETKKSAPVSKAMELLGNDLPEMTPEDAENAAAEKAYAEGLKTGKPPSKSVSETAPAKNEADVKPEKDAVDQRFENRSEWKALHGIDRASASKIRPVIRSLLEKENRLNEQLNGLKPSAEELKSLKQIVGEGQPWQFFNQVTQLFSRGDEKCIPILEEMVNQVKKRNGHLIQSDDLKQKVARINQAQTDGLITPEDAAERLAELTETEKSRAQARNLREQIEQQNRLKSQAEAQQREQSAVQEYRTALDNWETALRQTWPNFGNLTAPDDPNHGVSMADQVFAELNSRLAMTPPKTQEELLSLAQKSVEVVQRRLKAYEPPPKPMKPVTSENSFTTARPVGRNWKERASQNTSLLYAGT
jgi:hypothetical protein